MRGRNTHSIHAKENAMHADATHRSPLLARTLLLGLAAGLSLAAQAGEADRNGRVNAAVKVSYADLDLTDTAGARTLYARLKSAAREACGPEPSVRDLHDTADYRSCYEYALNKAVHGVDSQQLKALHESRARDASVG
jgi:UrcA family protein